MGFQAIGWFDFYNRQRRRTAEWMFRLFFSGIVLISAVLLFIECRPMEWNPVAHELNYDGDLNLMAVLAFRLDQETSSRPEVKWHVNGHSVRIFDLPIRPAKVYRASATFPSQTVIPLFSVFFQTSRSSSGIDPYLAL